MDRYEARLDGEVEVGETFMEYDELTALKSVFERLDMAPEPITSGRGGYYLFQIVAQGKNIRLHVYLKKLTFGGRDNRPYEKRAQFSASLDRRGFDAVQSENEISLILAIYQREEFSDTAICAWDIEDWGVNVGRAFNCFIDIHTVARALKEGIAQHETSIGQIACCFQPSNFLFYLNNRSILHKRLLDDTEFKKAISVGLIGKTHKEPTVPKFDQLFQHVIDAMRLFNGVASVEAIEGAVADNLNLPFNLRTMVHNLEEGNRTELGYQLAWARNCLKRGGFVANPKRGIWVLTQLGESTSSIDAAELKRKINTAQVNADVEKDFREDISIDNENNDVEKEEIIDNASEILNPFDPNDVDIRTRTMSLDLIIKRLASGEIDMATSFQRKAGLWDIVKQSRLIESILIKFPLPAFYFDGSDDDKWLVVDGLQRLSTLDNFVVKRATKLQKLEFLRQFEDKKFVELPKNLQRRIEEFEITAYIISPGTPKALKYNVFKRINTGGLTLTPQEIRNAIYQGAPAEFVKALAELKSFKEATAYSIADDRMVDREFTTRFLAFYLTSYEEYDSDLDSFLNAALEKVYELTPVVRDQVFNSFDRAMTAAFEIFRDDAFRKRYDPSDKRKPINKALFEVWSVLLSKLSQSELQRLVQNRQVVLAKFSLLLNVDNDFNASNSTGTGDKSKVRRRFGEISEIIKSVIHDN